MSRSLVFIIALVFSTQGMAADVEQLLQQYGKKSLISFIFDKRHGEISTEQGGWVSNSWGRPNPDFITPKSILTDAEKMGLSEQEFVQAFTQWINKKNASKVKAEEKRKLEAEWNEKKAAAEQAASENSKTVESAPRTSSTQQPYRAGQLGKPQNSSAIQFKSAHELQQDESYQCYRNCEYAFAECQNKAGHNMAAVDKCFKASNACTNKCKSMAR